NNQPVNIMSSYIPPSRDSNNELVPTDSFLDKMETATRSLSCRTLIGGDFNGHHTLWGSEHSNQRGREILNFANSNGFELLNEGDEPTFYASRGDRVICSRIDLTFASEKLFSEVISWRVSDLISTSDHRTIEMRLRFDNPSK